MRVGIDAFTIRDLNLSPKGVLDYVKGLGFEGVQFGNVRWLNEPLDFGALRDFRAEADEMGLYTHVSVQCINPYLWDDGFDALQKRIEAEIAGAAAGGWHELHTFMNGGFEKYEHEIPWQQHIDASIEMVKRLTPTLERYGSRLNIETHGESSFDILQVIEAAGDDLVGVCLDMANTLVNAEDPVLAAKRVAPYTHLTHTKDAIVAFCDEGIIRQGKAPGQGCVDFETILPILGQYCPGLPLSIEDHKWFFTAKIFDADWMAKNPELTPFELGQFVKLAWETQKKLDKGSMPSLEEYEKTPYLDEMEARLAAGRDYLFALLDKLNLRG